jgi:hypothetical protein
LYLNICETGDYTLLIKKGVAGYEQCAEKWDIIVKTNAEATGNTSYSNYFYSMQAIALLQREFLWVKYCVLKLAFVVDDETISKLKKRGYKINTATASGYVESLNNISRRADNLQTRIKLKERELEHLMKGEDNGTVTVESLLAGISAELGFTIPSDITLARYNEYQKIIKQRHAAKRKEIV